MHHPLIEFPSGVIYINIRFSLVIDFRMFFSCQSKPVISWFQLSLHRTDQQRLLTAAATGYLLISYHGFVSAGKYLHLLIVLRLIWEKRAETVGEPQLRRLLWLVRTTSAQPSVVTCSSEIYDKGSCWCLQGCHYEYYNAGEPCHLGGARATHVETCAEHSCNLKVVCPPSTCLTSHWVSQLFWGHAAVKWVCSGFLASLRCDMLCFNPFILTMTGNFIFRCFTHHTSQFCWLFSPNKRVSINHNINVSFVTDGLKLWWMRAPSSFVASGTTS